MEVVLVLFSTLCVYAGLGEAIRCYHCQNSLHPHDCGNVTSCSSGDYCYIEEVATLAGTIVYNTGCMAGNRCPVSSQIVGKRSGDLTMCIECCQGDFCNDVGCGITSKPLNERGPYCFHCAATREGQQCHHVIACAKDEICATHIPRDYLIFPEIVIESSCLSKATCLTLQHAYINTKCAPTCCDTDYCNTHCNSSFPHSTTGATTPRRTATTQHSTTPSHPPTTTASPCPIDHDYDPLSGLCVKIIVPDHRVSWYKAQEGCATIGDTLVSIDSQRKTAFINSLLEGSHFQLFWIGGRDQYDTSIFYWSNGKVFDYTNWGGGDNVVANQQPDDSRHNRQNCVFIFKKDYNRWHDDRCYSLDSAYICEHSPHITPLIMSYVCDTSGDYVDLGGGLCVHIHRNKQLDWQHARVECQGERAQLVVLDTQMKFNVLDVYLDTHEKTRSFWIGGYDKHKNNTFYWITGEPFTDTNWYIDPYGHHTQPDHVSLSNDAEDCVATYPYRSTHHMWHDSQCNNQKMFICQRT